MKKLLQVRCKIESLSMSLFEQESLAIQCQGETLLLHPHRALYWPARKTLLVADVHVGKEHRFGRAGIAIPGGVSDDVLIKLFGLCNKAGATRLVILGDFMHSVPLMGESWLATLSQILNFNPQLSVDIVAGNHDRLAGQLMVDKRIIWHKEELRLSPFVLRHEPEENSEKFMLAGHIHPAWRLSQSRRLSLKAPVFWFRPRYAVLPAFGDFTGGVVVTANQTTDSLYVAGPERVLRIPMKQKMNN